MQGDRGSNPLTSTGLDLSSRLYLANHGGSGVSGSRSDTVFPPIIPLTRSDSGAGFRRRLAEEVKKFDSDVDAVLRSQFSMAVAWEKLITWLGFRYFRLSTAAPAG